jgi:uncharacterized protein
MHLHYAQRLARLPKRQFRNRQMIALLACVVLALGTLYALQRRLIYFPGRMSRLEFEATVGGSLDSRASILAPFDAIVFEPTDDIGITGTAIYFHGNAGLGLERAYLAPAFTGRGLRFILAEYPGYGARAGTPTERSLVEDAAALYVKAGVIYPNSPIILVGESLGAAVAVQVATRTAARPPSRLVLLTPFLSLADTAARVYPLLPVRYLLKDRFDSARQLPRFKGAVAILVAGEDEVVGPAQGRALAELSRSRGETVCIELPDAGHNSWIALISATQWTELLGVLPIGSKP